MVADIGLRLSEGIQELKLDQQLAPAREAVSRTLAAGSTNFFNAVAGVRERWMRNPSSSSSVSDAASPPSLSKVNTRGSDGSPPSERSRSSRDSHVPATPTSTRGLRPLSIVGAQQLAQPEPPKLPPSSFGWGSNIGSFFSQRAARLSISSTTTTSRPPSVASLSRGPSPVPPIPSMPSDKDVPPVPKDMPPIPKDMPPLPSQVPRKQEVEELPELPEELRPKNLDEVNAHATADADTTATGLKPEDVEGKDKAQVRLKEEDAMSTHSSVTGMAL